MFDKRIEFISTFINAATNVRLFNNFDFLTEIKPLLDDV